MKKLVSIRHHQGPMYAVLKRAGIGSADKYGRGIWITDADIPSIRAYFSARGNVYGTEEWWLNGTNQHNQVFYTDFVKLFG